MKKINAFFLSFIVVFGSLFSAPVLAADTTARAISILTAEGANVTMTKGTVKEFKAKEGLKLLDGYTVTTGSDSGCTLNLDDTATVVLDQNSKVEISKISTAKLSVSVLSGTVAVNAAPQKAGRSVEIGAGNSTMAIRGTLFTFGNAPDGSIQVNMIEGKGDFDGYAVTDRETLNLSPGKAYNKTELTLDENSGLFLLETILANKDTLLATGKFSEEYFEDVQTIAGEIEAAEQNNSGEAAPSGGSSSGGSSSSSGGSSSGGGSNNNNSGNNSKPRYTVTYDLNVSGANSVFAPKESAKTSDAAFTAAFVNNFEHPDGYEFLSWNTEPDGSGKIYKPGETIIMPNHNLTLYAVWKEISKVKVILNSGWHNGREQITYEVIKNSEYKLPANNPFGSSWNSKYDLYGWYSSFGYAKFYKPGETISVGESDITLYATWKAKDKGWNGRD